DRHQLQVGLVLSLHAFEMHAQEGLVGAVELVQADRLVETAHLVLQAVGDHDLLKIVVVHHLVEVVQRAKLVHAIHTTAGGKGQGFVPGERKLAGSDDGRFNDSALLGLEHAGLRVDGGHFQLGAAAGEHEGGKGKGEQVQAHGRTLSEGSG